MGARYGGFAAGCFGLPRLRRGVLLGGLEWVLSAAASPRVLWGCRASGIVV